MKTDKSDFGEIRHLFIKTKDVDPQNPNLIWATISTDEVDRYDEIVLPDAFKESLAPFIANPVVLPAHMNRLLSGEPPVIGNVVVDSIEIKERNVTVAILFDDDELGQKYARKYRTKMMRAFSIGFRGVEGKWEENDGNRVWIWTKIELLEVSAVAVPANRGALIVAAGYYEHGQADSELTAVKQLLTEHSAYVEKLVLDLKSTIATEFEEITSLLIANQDGYAERLLGGNHVLSGPAGDKMAEHFQRIQKLVNSGG